MIENQIKDRESNKRDKKNDEVRDRKMKIEKSTMSQFFRFDRLS